MNSQQGSTVLVCACDGVLRVKFSTLYTTLKHFRKKYTWDKNAKNDLSALNLDMVQFTVEQLTVFFQLLARKRGPELENYEKLPELFKISNYLQCQRLLERFAMFFYRNLEPNSQTLINMNFYKHFCECNMIGDPEQRNMEFTELRHLHFQPDYLPDVRKRLMFFLYTNSHYLVPLKWMKELFLLQFPPGQASKFRNALLVALRLKSSWLAIDTEGYKGYLEDLMELVAGLPKESDTEDTLEAVLNTIHTAEMSDASGGSGLNDKGL